MENLLWKVEEALLDKTFSNGLSAYGQAKCKCTLTDNGYRIYREPNNNYDSSNRTMWGGLIIDNFNNYLKTNHTYILKWHVKGQSTNSSESFISYTAGWSGGGGLTYGTSTSGGAVYDNIGIPSGFNGEKECIFKFKVGSSMTMEATKADSGYTVGEQYNVYKQFKFGFHYANTGALGTDIYITNIRMYDVTNGYDKVVFNKNSIINTNKYIEENNLFSVCQDGEIFMNEIIEY